VKPLGDRLGITTNVVEAKDTQELIRQILTTHRGQTIFVAGHNNTAPEIVKALGGGDFPVIPENDSTTCLS
jgi:ABC-type hemin transport system substrate-binding protein